MGLTKSVVINRILDRIRPLLMYSDSAGRLIQAVVQVDSDGNASGAPAPQRAPFGEAMTASMKQVAQLKCPNDVLNQQTFSQHNAGSGATSADSGEILTQSGTTTGSISYMHSKRFISYKTGLGAEARFTAYWPDGLIAGHESWVGVGDFEDSLLVGHNGTDWGYMRRSGGQVEIRVLTITGAPSTGGNITITLNGGAGVVVAILGTDSIGDVSRKIAEASFASEGGGWDYHGDGEAVDFLALGTEARSGVYSFVDTGGTGCTAAFSTIASAVASTENFTALSSWTQDQADGEGVLPVYDLTKGLPFKLSWQWLGYGPIRVYMENSETGDFVLAHVDRIGNRQTVPSLGNPDMPLAMFADNGATSTNASVRSSSLAGFITEDGAVEADVRHSVEASRSVSTTEIPILAIKLKHHHNGKTNKIRAAVDSLVCSSDASKPSTFKIYKAISHEFSLTGAPTWTDVDAGTSNSVMAESSDATGFVGGDFLASVGVASLGSENVALEGKREVWLAPGDILLVTAQVNSGGSASNLKAAFSWREAW